MSSAQVIQFPTTSTTNYEDFAKSKNTKRAYDSDWLHFSQWCNVHHQVSVPALSQTICDYISELADQKFKLSTIKRRLASIVSYHHSRDMGSPVTPRVNEKLKGIARVNGRKQTPKKAIMLKDLKEIINSIDITTLSGKRDKAMILLGFSTASRRSEIVSMDIENVNIESEGMDIKVWIEKTNEHVIKTVVNVDSLYCPINSLRLWIEAANITKGAIFRNINRHGQIGDRLTGKSVGEILKKHIGTTELDPTLYAAHSMRSGIASSAGKKGYNESSIMRQGNWKTPSIAAGYQQNGLRFENNISAILRDI